VKHSELIRLTLSELVDYVKGKVKLILVLECDLLEDTVLLGGNNEVAINTATRIICISLGCNRRYCLLLAKSCRLVFEDYRIE
jgi:hypothetical protein